MLIFLRNLPNINKRMAGVFRSRVNPATARVEWVPKGETYDYYQEIARSGFADMLHDKERNVLYHEAIKRVVTDMRQCGESVHVLDIGTGTGLLAMMAAAAGADRVTACEAFRPIAETARKIIAANGFEKKIRLIEKRSTDMTSADMIDGPANVVVAEVFDTELIGEGALRTFAEAHARLLTDKPRVIPKSATVYVQVVNSNIIKQWAGPQPMAVTGSRGQPWICITPADWVGRCPGSPAVHDLQLDQLPSSAFTPLTQPIPIFKFDFEDPASLAYSGMERVEVQALASSTAHAVLMWWELDMDGSGELILSMKPDWNRRFEKPWRDHWMQAIYYLPKPINVSNGSPFWLIGCHDEHSLWFHAKLEQPDIQEPLASPVCECGHHMICSHSNTAYFNDQSRYQKIIPCLEQTVLSNICLCISDCSRLPLIAMKMGALQVYALQQGQLRGKVLDEYAKANGIKTGQSIVLISDLSEIPDHTKIECVFGDPFFSSALLPWHNLHFWFKLDEARKRRLLLGYCHILPKRAHLKCVALETKDLWKIRAPVTDVEGFNLRLFGSIVHKAIALCDAQVEPHHLWEYPSLALSPIVNLMSFNLTSDIPNAPVHSDDTRISLVRNGSLNALAFWMDWEFGNDIDGEPVLITSGVNPSNCEPGQQPSWTWHNRQGVYFFPQPFHTITNDVTKEVALTVRAKFDPALGDISFDIRLEDVI